MKRSGTCSPPARTSSSLTSPTCRPAPEEARRYGVAAINRALEGVTGTTAVHLCFGYAAIIHDRPSGYSFLPELAAATCDQISIETAQSNLDCSVLAALAGKTIILGVLNLGDHTVESAEDVAARVRRALPHVPADRLVLAPDCGMKYLPRDIAYAKPLAMTQAAAHLRAESSALQDTKSLFENLRLLVAGVALMQLLAGLVPGPVRAVPGLGGGRRGQIGRAHV